MGKLISSFLLFLVSMPLFAEEYAKYQSVSRDPDGTVVDSATVTVYEAGTLDIVQIYGDNLGAVLGNPFLTDINGNYEFFVPPGLYKVTVSKIGHTSNTSDYISIGTQLHASRHETGGEDEISVDGLSGTLATEQPILIEIDGAESGIFNSVDFLTIGDVSVTYTDGLVFDLNTDSVDSDSILDATIANVDIAAGAAILESKLSLNFPTHTTANDPSAGQKAALVGTSGTPSGANQYVTNSDTRLSNTRVPILHASSHEVGGGDELAIDWDQLIDVPVDFVPELHASSHQNGGSDEISVAGLSGELAEPQKVAVYKDGILISSIRDAIEFTEGGNTALTVVDDSGNGRVRIQIDALGYTGDLDGISDVDTTGAATGEALVYDGIDWVPSDETVCLSDTTNCPDLTPDDLTDNSIDDLDDVSTTGATNGHGLVFDTGNLVVSADPLCLLDGTNCPTVSLDEVGSGTSSVALTIGTGGSLGVSGSGTIAATSLPFSGITGGTNTTGTFTIGTGSSLTTSGSGTISATSTPFSGLVGGTNTTGTFTLGTGASLTTSGSGTVTATTAAALVANPTNCSAGSGTGGIAANGDAEDCGAFNQDDLSNNTIDDLNQVDLDALSVGEGLVWDSASWVDTPVCSGFDCTVSGPGSFAGGVIANESGLDQDTRIEGDSLTHMLVADASAATENIGLLSGSMPNWQSMDRGVFVGQATTAPTGNPADGVYLWTADTVAGQTNLYARNENGKVEQLTGLADAVSTQFDVTASTTPVAITGLSHNVEAGKRYSFEVKLHCTDTLGGGVRVSIGGTATATTIIYQTEIYRSSNMSITASGRHTSLSSASTGAPPAPYVVINGYIQVNTAGTLTPLFAQDTATGVSSVLPGSTFILTPVGD